MSGGKAQERGPAQRPCPKTPTPCRPSCCYSSRSSTRGTAQACLQVFLPSEESKGIYSALMMASVGMAAPAPGLAKLRIKLTLASFIFLFNYFPTKRSNLQGLEVEVRSLITSMTCSLSEYERNRWISTGMQHTP